MWDTKLKQPSLMSFHCRFQLRALAMPACCVGQKYWWVSLMAKSLDFIRCWLIYRYWTFVKIDDLTFESWRWQSYWRQPCQLWLDFSRDMPNTPYSVSRDMPNTPYRTILTWREAFVEKDQFKIIFFLKIAISDHSDVYTSARIKRACTKPYIFRKPD